jgi:hypothetical protein
VVGRDAERPGGDRQDEVQGELDREEARKEAKS